MCQDIETSKTILDQYNQDCKTQKFISKSLTKKNLKQIYYYYFFFFFILVNFNIIILNSNAWLFSIPINIILPNNLELIYKNFSNFYNHLYNGRKLIFLYQYSNNELQTFFTDKIYTLQVRISIIFFSVILFSYIGIDVSNDNTSFI